MSFNLSANCESANFANRKSASCHRCGRPAIITNFVSPKICGFAFCGTYLQTAHLFRMHNILSKKSANYCFQFRTGGGGPHIILVPINKTNKRGVHIVRLKYGYAAHMCVHDLGSFSPLVHWPRSRPPCDMHHNTKYGILEISIHMERVFTYKDIKAGKPRL